MATLPEWQQGEATGRAEHYADRWAAEQAMPMREIATVADDPDVLTVEDLAARFGVTVAFARRALAFLHSRLYANPEDPLYPTLAPLLARLEGAG